LAEEEEIHGFTNTAAIWALCSAGTQAGPIDRLMAPLIQICDFFFFFFFFFHGLFAVWGSLQLPFLELFISPLPSVPLIPRSWRRSKA
jgi:hypothetical protein